jgi:hypothetical protein
MVVVGDDCEASSVSMSYAPSLKELSLPFPDVPAVLAGTLSLVHV